MKREGGWEKKERVLLAGGVCSLVQEERGERRSAAGVSRHRRKQNQRLSPSEMRQCDSPREISAKTPVIHLIEFTSATTQKSALHQRSHWLSEFHSLITYWSI
jgi:hypothetical protein